MAATPSPNLILYFLSASRAIRIAWLLEELSLPYELVSSDRGPDNLAPAEFRAKIPSVLGKSPTLKDGDLVVQESGAIVEYILETYPSSTLLPPPSSPHLRSKVREYMAAAEATFMIHALPILYARLHLPEPAKSDGVTLKKLEQGMGKNLHRDFDWLEFELSGGGGEEEEKAAKRHPKKYLVGESLTAADIMVMFSVQFILKRGLGIVVVSGGGKDDEDESKKDGIKWPNVRRWLKELEQEEGYKRAVQRTGYRL